METLFNLFYQCDGVSTDSRKIRQNCLYIGLVGPNFDGGAFAQSAIESGAKYAIVSNKLLANNSTIFYVENTLRFLQQLAHFHRNRFQIPVIGITGSNGKTTTKELVNAVLSTTFNSLCTKGNLNNHIGVPLTLLELNESHELAIIEMGANKPGDIKELVEIARPTIGIVTNIGKAHLEGFIDLNGVIKTKSELFDFIAENEGTCIFNADDEILNEAIKKRSLVNTYSYSTSAKGLVNASNWQVTPYLQFSYQTENYQSPVIQTHLVGLYNLSNFLTAITLGKLLKVSFEKINEGITNYTPTNNRSQVTKTVKNTLILDCYNANPSSMKNALISFSEIESASKLAILGDMLEMGTESEKEHLQIVEQCKSLQLNVIFVGKEFGKVTANVFENSISLKEHLEKNPIDNKLILLKGSRGIALEKIVEAL
ncbi:MAG: hypothetical protein RL264_2071 [Bacteroidota bacterium]|jgi:UDP-N-acetylmuramoyl-tripeptide--D-alanyl-D-alanine ligase